MQLLIGQPRKVRVVSLAGVTGVRRLGSCDGIALMHHRDKLCYIFVVCITIRHAGTDV